MANFKNITDLPMVESAEGINLIVNDNGSAKQIAASAVGGGVKSWNNLEDKPFDSKIEMVEFLSEQSVTGELRTYIEQEYYAFTMGNKLTAHSKYIVNINGTEYRVEANDKATIGERFNFTTLPFAALENRFDWSIDLGETITLTIYEEQEIIKPLDPKFVGVVAVKLEVVKDDEGQTLGLKSSIPPIAIHKMMTKGIPVIGYDDTHTYTLAIGGEPPHWELLFACVDDYAVSTYRYFSYEKHWSHNYSKLNTEKIYNERYENITD